MIVFVTGLFCFNPAFYISLFKAPATPHFKAWQFAFGSQLIGGFFGEFQVYRNVFDGQYLIGHISRHSVSEGENKGKYRNQQRKSLIPLWSSMILADEGRCFVAKQIEIVPETTGSRDGLLLCPNQDGYLIRARIWEGVSPALGGAVLVTGLDSTHVENQ